jgi:hypothetical protein
MIEIICPLCGRTQMVEEKDYRWQVLFGHGYTCDSDTCPSHTYMVINND